jgi:hypothetical protein
MCRSPPFTEETTRGTIGCTGPLSSVPHLRCSSMRCTATHPLRVHAQESLASSDAYEAIIIQSVCTGAKAGFAEERKDLESTYFDLYTRNMAKAQSSYSSEDCKQVHGSVFMHPRLIKAIGNFTNGLLQAF